MISSMVMRSLCFMCKFLFFFGILIPSNDGQQHATWLWAIWQASIWCQGQKNLTHISVCCEYRWIKELPPLIIGKAWKPHAFKNKTGAQLGFNYMSNTKAWMTSAIYQEWLLDWDQKLKNKNCKILLLQDNFLGHVVPESIMNICVMNFKPNLTAHI